MINDFYTRKEDDVNYDPNMLEVNSPEEELIMQTKMILGTTKKSILGELDFGINLLDYLYSYNTNIQHIEDTINEQLMKYSNLAYQLNTHIRVSKMKTPDDKIALLSDIYVDNKRAFGLVF